MRTEGVKRVKLSLRRMQVVPATSKTMARLSTAQAWFTVRVCIVDDRAGRLPFHLFARGAHPPGHRGPYQGQSRGAH
jgi:hypothetical protein